MTSERLIAISTRDGASWLTLSRPERGNSLNVEMLNQLRNALGEFFLVLHERIFLLHRRG